MITLSLPKEILCRMNVSAQPKISPFRYPGGKTRLAELVHFWIMSETKPKYFIEPFAGGASVGLYVASKNLSKKVRLIEIDTDVAAVWQTILSSDYKWLSKKIMDFEVSRNNVLDLLEKESSDTRQKAFKTLVRNRVGRSGLIWKGAGLTRNGEGGKGLSSRWYPETIVSRINHINSLREKIEFKNDCGIEEIKNEKSNATNCWFIDPPYTVNDQSVGQRLYRHSDIDHELLFKVMSKNCINFLMTHENSRGVRDLVRENSLQMIKLPLMTGQNKKGYELLIGKDLDGICLSKN